MAFKALYLAITISGLALGQTGPVFGGGDYGPGRPFGPWGLNITEFDQDLSHPNATTTTFFPTNITSVPTLTGADEPWSWSISVKDDIPVANGPASLSAEEKAKFFTGTKVTLNAPMDLSTSLNKTAALNNSTGEYRQWGVCVMTWPYGNLYNFTFPDKFRQDDGSCTSIVSSQCVKDIEAAAAKSYPTRCQCPVVRDIPSCEKNPILSNISCTAFEYNATNVAQWPDGHWDVISYGGSLHDKGNITAYNETGSLTWPVMVSWANTLSRELQTHPSNSTAKLSCLRAMNATEGSVAPGWNSTSGSPRTDVGFGMLWVFVCLFVVLCV